MIHETSENKVMLEFLNLLAVQESVFAKNMSISKLICSMWAGMARPGVLGGQEPPKKFTEPPPPSALEFLKISVHCRHLRNLLVMLLESVVAF